MTRDGKNDAAEPQGRTPPRIPKYGQAYESLERWVSHWYQMSAILRDKPDSILEIGIGSDIVSNYLRRLGYEVVTLDIDPGLSPDVVGSITEMPFSVETFDVVSAFEVLEHPAQGSGPARAGGDATGRQEQRGDVCARHHTRLCAPTTDPQAGDAAMAP